MRILVVGAGAVGGYYGGRLAQSGADVTFLVRPARAAKLQKTGLVIKSPTGDATITPKLVQADALKTPFDAVILSCKAYDLEAAMADMAGGVGPETMIIPLLNGMRHLDALEARFGANSVLGGQCQIMSTLGAEGEIILLSPMHKLSFGERAGGLSPRVEKLGAIVTKASFDGQVSETIVQDMWEKWLMLGSLAGCTAGLRAPTGDIASTPAGRETILAVIEEIASVATAAGHAPRGALLDTVRGNLTDATQYRTASMFRDLEQGYRIEADQIIGDLIARGKKLLPEHGFPRLTSIYASLKAYESRQARAAQKAAA